jgi:hypothetical protein
MLQGQQRGLCPKMAALFVFDFLALNSCPPSPSALILPRAGPSGAGLFLRATLAAVPFQLSSRE